jgi:hypothetical protein
VLDLVTEADKELHVASYGVILVREDFFDASREFPRLEIAIDLDAAATLSVPVIRAIPIEPRLQQEEQRGQLEQMRTIVRDKHVPVSNVDKHRPGDVCKRVSEVLGVKFTASSDHVRAWKHYKVRPPTGAANPRRTDARFCVYDEAHNDYVFTDAWVGRLTSDLSDPENFRKVIGHRPIPLPDIETDLVPSRDENYEPKVSR